MSKNPFLERVAKKGSSGHGSASEKRVAKSLSARLTPASGALAGAKGDATFKRGKTKYRLECKSTIHASMSLDLGWLVKIAHEALTTQSNPALSVSFVTPEGKPKLHGEWVMVPKYLFQELTNPEE